MYYIFKMPKTAAECVVELEKLVFAAIEVMCPENRRRLKAKRTYLNTCYDKVSLLANTKGNLLGDTPEGKEWQDVAAQSSTDRKVLTEVKDKMQENSIQIW